MNEISRMIMMMTMMILEMAKIMKQGAEHAY